MWLLQTWFPTGLSFVATVDKNHSFLPTSTGVSNGHQAGGSDPLPPNSNACPSYPRLCWQEGLCWGYSSGRWPLGPTLLLTCSRGDALAPLYLLPKKAP